MRYVYFSRRELHVGPNCHTKTLKLPHLYGGCHNSYFLLYNNSSTYIRDYYYKEVLLMLDYIETLRLMSLHTTMRKMELSLKSHHSTISEFFKRADACNLTWPVPDGTTNESICTMLYPERANDLLGLRAEQDYETIHKDLAKRGTNLTLLWEEYEIKARNAGLIPYKYSEFCDHYRNWSRKKKALCVLNTNQIMIA